MRYDEPQLIEQLAAAYVLGTLTGGARRRFERMARVSQRIQQATWRWERRINPLAEELAPVQPSGRVWQGIADRLEPARAPTGKIWFWRGLSAALTLAVLALLLPIFQAPTQLTTEQLALIQDSEQQPLWVVSVDLDAGVIRTRAINAPARDVDRVFELWMLPADGPPQSFGLLPVTGGSRAQHQISPALLALLRGSKGLAVSIEPVGGSPTGLPTGPVVYTAAIVEL